MNEEKDFLEKEPVGNSREAAISEERRERTVPEQKGTAARSGIPRKRKGSNNR